MPTKHTPAPWTKHVQRLPDSIIAPGNTYRIDGTIDRRDAEHPYRIADVVIATYVRADDVDLVLAAHDLAEACALVLKAYGHLDELVNPCVQACRQALLKAGITE